MSGCHLQLLAWTAVRCWVLLQKGGRERKRKKGCNILEDGLSWCSLHLEEQARHGRQELPITTFYLTVTIDKW